MGSYKLKTREKSLLFVSKYWFQSGSFFRRALDSAASRPRPTPLRGAALPGGGSLAGFAGTFRVVRRALFLAPACRCAKNFKVPGPEEIFFLLVMRRKAPTSKEKIAQCALINFSKQDKKRAVLLLLLIWDGL